MTEYTVSYHSTESRKSRKTTTVQVPNASIQWALQVFFKTYGPVYEVIGVRKKGRHV